MKNVVILVVVIVLAVVGWFAWKKFQEKVPLDEGRTRVQNFLDALGSRDSQKALCMWAAGKVILSEDEIAANSDRFDAFLRGAGLESVAGYEIGEARLAGAETVLVPVEAGGRSYTFKVTPGRPIELAR